MKDSGAKKDSKEPQRGAKLVGYVNPLGVIPSFLIPIFQRDGELVMQESNSDETIKSFYPFDENEFGKPGKFGVNFLATEGVDTLYGFVFPSGSLVVGSKKEVSRRLIKNLKTLTQYRFLYMEVLDFLGRYGDLTDELDKVEKFYAGNRLLSGTWTKTERASIAEKKTLLVESVPSTGIDLFDPVQSRLGINLPDDFVRRVASIQAKKRGHRTERVGIVSSDRMTKTVVVRVDRLVRHSKYRRYLRRTSKFMAHDELGAAIGDRVRIVETRPLSARKRWRVVEIIQKADF